jgi:RNA polymerase sigma-70 factor (ECF subfamily)
MSKLFDLHAADLLRFFMRRTFDHEVAIDLVSETYAEALESRKRFRGKSLDEARPWLFGIGRHLLMDYFRNGQIERRAMERLRIEAPAADAGDIARIEELAGIAELRKAVAKAIVALPLKHRQALELRVVRQLDYASVANSLGVSEQVARARVSRALKRLRDEIDLGEHEEGSEYARA